jgi:hypothetical protein
MVNVRLPRFLKHGKILENVAFPPGDRAFFPPSPTRDACPRGYSGGSTLSPSPNHLLLSPTISVLLPLSRPHASAPWLLLRPSPRERAAPLPASISANAPYPNPFLFAPPAVPACRAAGRFRELRCRPLLRVLPHRAYLMDTVTAVDMLQMWAVGRGGCCPRRPALLQGAVGVAASGGEGRYHRRPAGQPCCKVVADVAANSRGGCYQRRPASLQTEVGLATRGWRRCYQRRRQMLPASGGGCCQRRPLSLQRDARLATRGWRHCYQQRRLLLPTSGGGCCLWRPASLQKAAGLAARELAALLPKVRHGCCDRPSP